MKFLSFILNGESKFGIYNEKTVTDLTNKINSASTLKELISKKSIQEAKKYALKPALPSQMIKRSVNALTYQADKAIMHMDYDQFLLSREFSEK